MPGRRAQDGPATYEDGRWAIYTRQVLSVLSRRDSARPARRYTIDGGDTAWPLDGPDAQRLLVCLRCQLVLRVDRDALAAALARRPRRYKLPGDPPVDTVRSHSEE